MPTTPPALTPADIERLARDPALFARGEKLWASGGVLSAARRGASLMATVRGAVEKAYNVAIEPPGAGKRRWGWSCDCYFHEHYGGPCKHAVALLLAWANTPESVPAEATLDAQLAGPERAAALAERRERLRTHPAIKRLLSLPPERHPSRRQIKLAPYEEQIRYALSRHHDDPGWQADRLRGLLESAAGWLRVGDGTNAARLATILADAQLRLLPTPRAEVHQSLLIETLLVLEAAALDAAWPDGEQAAWLERATGWWALGPHDAQVADALLTLVMVAHRPDEESQVERWLRAILRQPIHANRFSQAESRERALSYLLARYATTGRRQAYLDLCWEEGVTPVTELA